MILTGVVLAVLVALLRGGKLERLTDLGLRWLPAVWVALCLRAIVPLLESRGLVWAPWLQVGAYLLLLWAVWLNVSVPGMKLFGLGSLLNFLVIVANGGTMPVSATAFKTLEMTKMPSGTHSLLTAETRLRLLADIIPIRTPLPQVISIGDIFLVAGIFLFIQHRMLSGDEARRLVSAKE